MAIVPMPVAEPLSLHPDLDGVIMRSEYRPSLGVAAFRFMEDEFRLVITPELASQLGGNTIALAELMLLPSRSAPNLCSEWCDEGGFGDVGFTRQQVFEDLVLAIGAARSGLGVAVARKASIESDLARGEMVAPLGFIHRSLG